MRRKLFILLTMLSLGIMNAMAQSANNNWLDDTFYEDGKYRVVIVILSIIFLGIMIFVAMLERRVRKLEKMNKGNAGKAD